MPALRHQDCAVAGPLPYAASTDAQAGSCPSASGTDAYRARPARTHAAMDCPAFRAAGSIDRGRGVTIGSRLVFARSALAVSAGLAIATATPAHPLDGLSPAEIEAVVETLKTGV